MNTFHEWLDKKTAPKITGPSIFAPLAQSSKQASQGTFRTKDVLKIKQNFTPKQIRRDRKATGISETKQELKTKETLNKQMSAKYSPRQRVNKLTPKQLLQQFKDREFYAGVVKRAQAANEHTDEDEHKRKTIKAGKKHKAKRKGKHLGLPKGKWVGESPRYDRKNDQLDDQNSE